MWILGLEGLIAQKKNPDEADSLNVSHQNC